MEEEKTTGSSRGIVDGWGSFLCFESLTECSLSNVIFLIYELPVLFIVLTLGIGKSTASSREQGKTLLYSILVS